jgi:hypothetical protein
MKSLLWLTLFGLLSLASVGRAAVLSPLGLDELAASSALVVRGTVVESRTDRDPADGLIFTEHTVLVTESLDGRGEAQRTVLVRTPGGEYQGLGQLVPGGPVLKKGQEVVLFLAAVPQVPGQVFTPRGGVQGVFRVQAKEGGVRLHRDFGAVAFAGSKTAVPSRELGLDEVLQAVRRAAATRKAR